MRAAFKLGSLPVPSDALFQWLLLIVSSVLVGALLIGLFRLRRRFGLPLFYLSLGVMQYLQVVLSATLYVPLFPGVLISPGSAVLFTASLAMILLMYLREGPLPARQLLYALVLANAVIGVVAMVISLHLQLASTVNVLNAPHQLFVQNPRIMFVGSAALLVDGILLVMLYEALSKLHRPVLRIFLTLSVVLVADSVMFVFGAFLQHPDVATLLYSAIIGKLTIAPIFAAMLALYLRLWRDGSAELLAASPRQVSDSYQFMTYREKYEAVRNEMELDALTRAYSRRFFDARLPHYIDLSRDQDRPFSLLMIDIDHFKQLNDKWGHQVGDQVLKIVSLAAKDAVRAGDRVCRYGGEEFAVLIMGADAALAVTLAERIRDKVKNSLTGKLSKVGPLTVSIGVATFPHDAETAERLVTVADGRLYEGKAAGRDRVVARQLPAVS